MSVISKRLPSHSFGCVEKKIVRTYSHMGKRRHPGQAGCEWTLAWAGCVTGGGLSRSGPVLGHGLHHRPAVLVPFFVIT